jgi:exonuclease III
MKFKTNKSKAKTKTTAPTVGTWNILDNKNAERPERRTALVARELARYNVDIAALSETRFAEEGQFTEIGAYYAFFWSGRKSEERREAGVGFAIKSRLIKNLTSLLKGINDHLMTM